MNEKFQFFLLFLISLINHCFGNIFILPKNNVLQGERFNISCQVSEYTGIMLWNHNGVNVAEDRRPYDLNFIDVTKIHNGFSLLIRNATLSHRGIWRCQTNKGVFSINVTVSVPWTLKAAEIKKKIPPRTSKSFLNETCNKLETGEKRWPYDLKMNESLVLTCKSECGLPGPKSIEVHYSNSTKSGELSGGNQKIENCIHNAELHKLTHSITINCQTKNLLGMNEIRCQSQDANGNSISNKPIYILCPDHSKPDLLTQGEIVAIGISIVLAAIDIIIIVFLLKRNCRKFSNYQYKSNSSEVML